MGGYFIIDGKEKTVIPQEEFGDNMLYVYKNIGDRYLFSLDLKSVSENASKPVRQLSLFNFVHLYSYNIISLIVF